MNEIYKSYDAVQLAADEAFISWVRGNAPAREADWQRWLEAHPDKQAEVEEAVSLVKGLSFDPETPKIDTDQLWSRIQASNRQPAEVRPIGGRRRFLFGIAGAVAAAVALVLFVLFGIDRPNQIRTAVEEQVATVLPDRSRVQVNADSRLTYDDSGRRIELDGEAYFEVETGTDFVVKTAKGQVQVLGTRFNVFSREDRFQVKCTEGRVRVTTSSDKEGVVLNPGMSCYLDGSGRLIAQTLSGPDAEIGWIQDTYRFSNQALSEVFEEMERQFGIRVEADREVRATIYSGFFDVGDLDQALQNVVWPLEMKYAIEGKVVIITKDTTE